MLTLIFAELDKNQNGNVSVMELVKYLEEKSEEHHIDKNNIFTTTSVAFKVRIPYFP